MSAPARRTGSLRPAELATAGVMAAVALAVTVIGGIIPSAEGLQLLAVVPFAVISARYRPRAAVASVVGALALVFLLSGIGSAVRMVACAVAGAIAGAVRRRGRGVGTILLAGLVVGPIAGGLAVGLLWVWGAYRKLLITSTQSTVDGIRSAFDHAGPLRPVGRGLSSATRTLLGHWPATFGIAIFIMTILALLVSWVLVNAVLNRLDTLTPPALDAPATPPDTAIAPLPVRLRHIEVRYGTVTALDGIDFAVAPGEFVAIVGDNGSGKSTLARVLAGTVSPVAGTVERPGAAGLGQPGGTALIMQRPDAQVLGAKAGEDIRWGLADDAGVDVDGLLTEVGLAGFADRDTSTLSGGQLQRLAVAAALARRPRLLISDESTAMVDSTGRQDLIRIFAELPRRHAIAVVHVTHDPDEALAADRVVRLADGRVLERPSAAAATVTRRADRDAGRARERLILAAVGHTYAAGTPWAHRALSDVNLTLGVGDGLLVVGDNGSGKTTLAWLLAGLLEPTEGTVSLDGQPTAAQRGAVGLAFQHPRLQLQRASVAADIADAAGWWGLARDERRERAAVALARVGLSTDLLRRPVDALSGGQQRRVAIAGLLARGPSVLVLDEPLAGLDLPSRVGLLDLLGQLRDQDDLTVVIISHDTQDTGGLCPRTIRLDHGRLVAPDLAQVPS